LPLGILSRSFAVIVFAVVQWIAISAAAPWRSGEAILNKRIKKTTLFSNCYMV